MKKCAKYKTTHARFKNGKYRKRCPKQQKGGMTRGNSGREREEDRSGPESEADRYDREDNEWLDEVEYIYRRPRVTWRTLEFIGEEMRELQPYIIQFRIAHGSGPARFRRLLQQVFAEAVERRDRPRP